MRAPFSALTALALLATASPALSQPTSWRSHADASRLREATDSFTVFVRGNAIGAQRLIWSKDATARNGWTMSDETTLTGITQRSDIRFSPALIELALRQAGVARGTNMRITLDRTNGRMTGEALTPSGGPKAVPMDVAVTDDVIDDNALTVVLPAIKWSEGLAFSIPVLSSGKGTIDTFSVSVTGKGTSIVPAGTFETWRITLAGSTYALLAEVTTTAPYRVVRLSPKGSPMDIQLVK